MCDIVGHTLDTGVSLEWHILLENCSGDFQTRFEGAHVQSIHSSLLLPRAENSCCRGFRSCSYLHLKTGGLAKRVPEPEENGLMLSSDPGGCRLGVTETFCCKASGTNSPGGLQLF